MRDQISQTTRSFATMLEQHWQRGKFVCVGLDLELGRLPASLRDGYTRDEALFLFAREIIESTHDLVCAYKPNSAFYEALGDEGIRALSRIVAYCKEHYPEIPIILDAKRADIGNTNHGYVSWAFDLLQADAITVHPYLGKEALSPFLARKEKGIIVLVKTSNPGSGELQNVPVGEAQEPLYLTVARKIAQSWNTNGNCAMVVGATYPEELQRVRTAVGDVPLLIPGIGAQGGDVAATVAAGKDSRGWGMIISSSRDIIYASSGDDFAQAARRSTEALHQRINQYR